jgi:hypothetical protein
MRTGLSQPDPQFGARSPRGRVLQGVETFADLFDLAGGAKGVPVVDGVADGDPEWAGVLDGGVVAVLGLL